MDISNIFPLYDGDGSPESPSLVPLLVPLLVPVVVPVVGFVEASGTVVILGKPVDGPLVEAIKQLQIKNNNNIIKEEVVQKLNKPDTNYAGVMALVTQQPCIIIKFHSSQWKQGVGKYS